MRKNLFLKANIFVFLALIVLASNLTPVLATTTVIDHQTATGQAVIDIEGHPKMWISTHHNDWAQSGGPRDLIRIWLWFPPTSSYVPAVYFTDNSQSVGFYEKMAVPYPTKIVEVSPRDIQVCRIGKIVLTYWTIPLQVPELKWYSIANPSLPPYTTPAVTIPPGAMIFTGYDGVLKGTETPKGLITATQTIDWTGYNARATLVCPQWHYCGPVGELTGQYATMIRTDALVTTIFK